MHTRGVNADLTHRNPFTFGRPVEVLGMFETFLLARVQKQSSSRSKELIPFCPVFLQLRTEVRGG